MAFPADATKVRKSVGYTELAEKVLKGTSLAKMVSGAIGDGNVGKGEQLKVFVHGLSTIQDYVAGTGVNLTGDNSDYVTVNNLRDIAVNEILDGLSLEQAYNETDYVEGRIEAAMEAVAERIDMDFLDKIRASTSKKHTTRITSSNVFAAILALKLELDKAKAPAEGRYLIVTPEAENAILGASNVILNTPTGEAMLYGGYIGNFLGFKVLRTNRLPFDEVGITQMVAMQARGAIFADGWKREIQLFELNDSAHVGDAKVAGRYAYNPGLVRPELVVHSTLTSVKITVDPDNEIEDKYVFYHASGELLAAPVVPTAPTGKEFDKWVDGVGTTITFNASGPKPSTALTVKAVWKNK